MPKERLEDLGRLAELLKIIGEIPVLELYDQRPKDFSDWFDSLTSEKKDDVLHDMAYQIQEIGFKLAECERIARGIED